MASTKPRQPSLFVISLDFELAWGFRHLANISDYLPNPIGARSAVGSLLNIFHEYEIHATWAVVGFLFADNGARLRQFAPQVRPRYIDSRLSPYLDLPPEDSRETEDSLFFAPSLIRQIASVRHQEIGSHTLSHYYCLEPGQDAESFAADLMAARSVAKQCGFELKSLVFPKNQWRAEFLSVCAQAGILAYRGNPPSWLYGAIPDKEKQSKLRRLGRLLDSYLPICSVIAQPLPWTGDQVLIDVPASRFLRPYSPFLRAFEPLRFARIKKEMTAAAKAGGLYHLWWHPHDFGVNTEMNLHFLRHIFDHYRTLRAAYGMESANMYEAAQKYFFVS